MPDAADIASDNLDLSIAARLDRHSAAMPAGVQGECDDCGEVMPRLVGGRCGFCRDGRRPPPERYAAAEARLSQPAALSPPTVKKEPSMATVKATDTQQTISVPASGAVLDAIRTRAQRDDAPLGRTVVTMLEEALATAGAAAPKLEAIDGVDLLAELSRRVSGAVPRVAYDELLSDLQDVRRRAEESEGRLGRARALLDGAQ